MSITVEECLGGQANLKDEKSGVGIEPGGLAGHGGPCGSEEAFEKFFLDNYNRVAAVLTRIVGDRSRAEELAIEAFWRFYRQPLAHRTPSDSSHNPIGWLYRTATRLGIDSLRAEARRGRYEQQAAAFPSATPQHDDPLDNVLRAERQGQIRKALAMLRPEQAQLLILRATGFSYEDLASILDVKRASIGAMLIRAEDEFRKRYVRLFGKKEEL
ncbi:MAG: sigma-70 family RNA polymerase sigma factor [Terriglobia bacterium]